MRIERKADARAESCNFEHTRSPYRRRVLRNDSCVTSSASSAADETFIGPSAEVGFPDDTATMIPPPIAKMQPMTIQMAEMRWRRPVCQSARPTPTTRMKYPTRNRWMNRIFELYTRWL